MPRDPRDLPSALDPGTLREHLASRDPLVFCDYDGTLTPIVEDPDAADLPPATRRALAQVAGRTLLAIVSGRGLDDVRPRVDLDGAWYAGSHGFELRDPRGELHERPEGREALPALDRAETALREALEELKGVVVERKRFAIAVHYRNAARDDARRARQAVEREERRHPGLRRSGGKEVRELRPDVDWDKGRALRWMLDEVGWDPERQAPVYLGDDLTDEDAFAAVSGTGVGILVGRHGEATRADLGLADPGEVRQLLERLARGEV